MALCLCTGNDLSGVGTLGLPRRREGSYGSGNDRSAVRLLRQQ
jgi:hypothetical protein